MRTAINDAEKELRSFELEVNMLSLTLRNEWKPKL
jgi:hypothetical protein